MKHDNKGENAKAIQGAVSKPSGDGSQKKIENAGTGPKDQGLTKIENATTAPSKA